jgi:ATP-dependent DNA ligase
MTGAQVSRPFRNAFVGGSGSRSGLACFAFDLLHLEGEDLSRARLEKRKIALLRLLRGQKSTARIRYSDHFVGTGTAAKYSTPPS